ncbi:Salicylate hydroxylase [Daldinia childiae]|uniref:Salicylate hydroxylase n=1 Tax=Daldinia childiae TaxID=326645 RepID=UPI001444DECD|nr:Salicylate hydroxylase [Daldinia childiae]KAF3068399.1 Salicylate hydroxylase [Daldinia childiae]
MAESTIRIAIIGGGLAGMTLAAGLTKIPHVDAQVYEAARDIAGNHGGSYTFNSTTQRSFERVIPSVQELLRRAGAVPNKSSRFISGLGPDMGTVIFDNWTTEPAPACLRRSRLLSEIITQIPEETIHTGKKLVTISSNGDGVEANFEDGTKGQFDAVIGADGIFGNVRKYVLGDTVADKYAAKPSGFWDIRVLQPYEKAKALLGEENFELDRQYVWIGGGSCILHDVLEDRTLVQCMICSVEAESPKDRRHHLTREYLMEILSDWAGNPVAKGMIDLILDCKRPYGYSQWEHRETPTYSNGRICIIGDAAHATSSFHGFGAGTSIEDAMVLKALFNNISSPNEIEAAFKAFDSVRRERSQRVVNSSREIGEICLGRHSEPDKFRRALAPKLAFIDAIDYEEHEKEAINKMREILKSQLSN